MRNLSFAVVSPVRISMVKFKSIPAIARSPDCRISFAKARIGVTQMAPNRGDFFCDFSSFCLARSRSIGTMSE